MSHVNATGLSQHFSDGPNQITLYEGLEFSANAGEITVIMGPSGSGKSSLLKQLSTIVPSPSGSLIIAGTAIEALDEKKRAAFRAKEVGFIFQSYALLEELSLLENCMVPLQIQNIPLKEAAERSHELLETFLPDVDARKFPHQLSGGEQQRAGIVRALVHDPGMVIADEPTGNLDGGNAAKVQAQLQHIAHTLGKCVIVVTHEEAYESMADRLYRFEPSTDASVKSILKAVR
jgi:ABC-type lipoprotein export system ATPase subunit